MIRLNDESRYFYMKYRTIGSRVPIGKMLLPSSKQMTDLVGTVLLREVTEKFQSHLVM